MLKKGGVFLSILFCATLVMAQDKTAEMFRIDNPNLMNLNESKEYTGEPLVYIQGVKAPEQATNDIEELQLKLFGTKNVREATKDTLTLSETSSNIIENTVQNLVFKSPFNQEIQSGFIPHIANFMTMIHILNRNQLTVSENVVLVNTKENEHWTRAIALPQNATAIITNYFQNGKWYPVISTAQENTLHFTSPEPLQLGPNHIVFKYNIENPFYNNQFNFQFVNATSTWPIEKFDALISFPTPVTIEDSKLLFGTNKMEIPQIYTQQSDKDANVAISINRIIPPKAAIQLQMDFPTSVLPAKENLHTATFMSWILVMILGLYWLIFGWWEKQRLHRSPLPKIKYPHTISALAYQMGTSLTENKWQQLIDFGKQNSWPLAKLLNEQNSMTKHSTLFKTKIVTFFSLMLEPMIGTMILILLGLISFSLIEKSISSKVIIMLITYGILGLILLYLTALKPTRKMYWQKKLQQLSLPTILTGLTSTQVRQIYPLFILTQKNEDWRKELIKTNPKVAQETHLYKEKK